MKRRYYKHSGMTLIELVVVLGLLAALATYALTSLDGLSDRGRVDTTSHRIEHIRKAIAGNGLGASRFVNDMGRLPDVTSGSEGEEFIELCQDAKGVGVMAASHSYTPSIGGQSFTPISIDAGYGWKGPYLETAYEKLYDGFGERFEIQTGSDTSWHNPGSGETGIQAVRSLGRDGTPGASQDWADNDIEAMGFDAMTSANLTIRVLLRGRAIVDDPTWSGAEIKTPLSSATTARAYSEGEVFLSSSGVFRCKSNVTLAGTITPPSWNTSIPGVVTTVTDSSGNSVEWEFLGEYHQYMTGVKAVVFEPDTTASPAGVREESVSISSGVVNTITMVNLTPGIRWLIVYGGLIGSSEKSNCWSSGLQSIELKPGENFITVHLTAPLN